MTRINIGGVPEYFNLPVHLAIERGLFEKEQLSVIWHDIAQGTGAMSQMLASGELDMAILLTEGIVKSIAEGNPSRIVKSFVSSPLNWGVHVPFSKQEEISRSVQNRKVAISRFGSGSHLMAILYAKQNGFEIASDQFTVVHTLDGARQSFHNNESDLFLWEHFTTKFLVDTQEFGRIDNIKTKWPCFVIAASNQFIDQYSNAIDLFCEVLVSFCDEIDKEVLRPHLANRFGIENGDIDEILNDVSWDTSRSIQSDELDELIRILHQNGILEKPVTPASLIYR